MIYLLLDLAPASRGNDAVLILAVLAVVVGIIVPCLVGVGALIFFLLRRSKKAASHASTVAGSRRTFPLVTIDLADKLT